MIYILSWTTKKHQRILSQASALEVEENSRTFQGLAQKFKDLEKWNSRTF